MLRVFLFIISFHDNFHHCIIFFLKKRKKKKEKEKCMCRNIKDKKGTKLGALLEECSPWLHVPLTFTKSETGFCPDSRGLSPGRGR
jgi:hypothetical protein